MKARELLKVLREAGCATSEGNGAHIKIQCGKCRSVVSFHAGHDIAKGTLRAIERQLEPCLGKGWLK